MFNKKYRYKIKLQFIKYNLVVFRFIIIKMVHENYEI